jgi:hypothetical protein
MIFKEKHTAVELNVNRKPFRKQRLKTKCPKWIIQDKVISKSEFKGDDENMLNETKALQKA